MHASIFIVSGPGRNSVAVVPLNGDEQNEDETKVQLPTKPADDCCANCYGCGAHSCGFAAITVLWPGVVVALMLMELLELINGLLLEFPIQLLRLISADNIKPLQIVAATAVGTADAKQQKRKGKKKSNNKQQARKVADATLDQTSSRYRKAVEKSLKATVRTFLFLLCFARSKQARIARTLYDCSLGMPVACGSSGQCVA